jgi:predicted DNA-binding transcriptional regulator AlpA
MSPGDRRVLNENELAQRWGISPKTLQRWRSEGRGPKYLKLSKRVSYPLETVIEFEASALHDSTSERSVR